LRKAEKLPTSCPKDLIGAPKILVLKKKLRKQGRSSHIKPSREVGGVTVGLCIEIPDCPLF